MQDIEHKDIQTTHTPNPMTGEEMQTAIALANKLSQETDPYIKTKLGDPQTQLIGVGNVFNLGLRLVVDKQVVEQKALENNLLKLAGKSDAELPGGAHVDVTLTNALMILGYMQGLHVDHVDLVSVNNADGALTYPPYWE